VPRFFLHLRFRDGADGLATDLEGDELPDADGLREHVVGTARDLMRTARLTAIQNWRDCTFEVTDEAGQLVLTLRFAQVNPDVNHGAIPY
jgi:hypothetical protein